MNKVTGALMVSFITNVLLTIFKIVIGLVFNSGALVADGVHSFSDLSTDIVAFVGAKISRKPADDKHPFGHGKSEYVTNLVIGAFVLLLSFGIISSTMNKEIVTPSRIVIYVSLFTILAKFLLSSFLIKSGKKLQNTILVSSGKESRADVGSSIVVLVASILMQYASVVPFLKYADICATIIVGLFIAHTGYSILKENISIILEEQDLDLKRQEKVEQAILKNTFVKRIDQFALTKYGPYSRLILELSMDGGLTLYKAHLESHKIEDEIKRIDERIQYITIHINVFEKDEEK